MSSRKKRHRRGLSSRSPLKTLRETSLSDSYALSIVERNTRRNKTAPVTVSSVSIREVDVAQTSVCVW